MNRRLSEVASAAGAATALAALVFASTAAADWKPDLMPRNAEMKAALAAGPSSIAESAGAYVLTATGFELARASSNGFHCIAERSHPGAFESQCFDAEGSKTLLLEVLLKGQLRMAGRSPSEIERAVATAWTERRLRAPARPGINYMLSPENRVPVDPEGTMIVPYRPHLMFYAPYLTNADLGSDGLPGSPLFVINEGQPGAYAIVPVPVEGKDESHDAH